MTISTTSQIRSWRGPAVFSYGFRPFFLMAGGWAFAAMVLWMGMLFGWFALPIRLSPAGWHAHEFVFGYTSAVIAGFLLTAVPNWTGRLPVVGWRLAALSALWAAGRVVMAFAVVFPPWVPVVVTMAFPLVLGAMILREIIVGKNWRNLPVLGLFGLFAAANLVFHVEAAGPADPSAGVGLRLGVATVIGMIVLVGGRIVPSFTRNWMVKHQRSPLPAPPMQLFDKVVLMFSIATLSIWVIWPATALTAAVLLIFAVLHTVRLLRWRGIATGAEPLLWVLHVAYALVPTGAVLIALAQMRPDLLAPASAQHVWMAGVTGLMTMAVMTRATLGHTGRELTADKASVAIYVALLGSVTARVIAGGLMPATTAYAASALLWLLAFWLFSAHYGRYLTRPKLS